MFFQNVALLQYFQRTYKRNGGGVMTRRTLQKFSKALNQMRVPLERRGALLQNSQKLLQIISRKYELSCLETRYLPDIDSGALLQLFHCQTLLLTQRPQHSADGLGFFFRLAFSRHFA